MLLFCYGNGSYRCFFRHDGFLQLLVSCMILSVLPGGLILAHKGCLTESRPLQELKMVQARIESAKRQPKNLFAASHSSTCIQCITIVTHFIVYQCSDGSTASVTRDTINAQFNVLVNGFAKSTFTFRLASIEFIVNNRLCRDFSDVSRTADHRKGGYNVLNIFLGGADNGSFGIFPIDGGLATVPFDGIFVDIATVPGGSSTCCGLGKTVIHEAGHWLGLEHTFGSSSNPCDPNDRNDFVDDTPAGFATEFNCPVNKDTCPSLPGLDPVQNYMDYSSDECYESFSPGQIERMYYVWSLYRQQQESCNPGYMLFEIELVVTDGGGGFENTFELLSEDETVQYWAGGGEGLNLVPVTFQEDIVNRLDICIAANQNYVFILYDSFSDGLGTGGYYELRFNGTAVRPRGPFPNGVRLEKTTFRGDGLPNDDAFARFFAVIRQIIELIQLIFGGSPSPSSP